MVQPTNSLFASFNLVACAEGHSLIHSWGFGVHSHFFGSDEMHSGDLWEVCAQKSNQYSPFYLTSPQSRSMFGIPILSHADSAVGSLLGEGLGREGTTGLRAETLSTPAILPTLPVDELIYCDTTFTQSITVPPDSRLRFHLHAVVSLVASAIHTI